ncbi:hypothetical protein SporoP37_15710 [Sporosarcina sp. P37]|uniref:hypothetical protein n=1 Tax=unclassified Sporosarcina TaxID=2647733 RepID=UPI000A17EB53|nr:MULTISPECIES: hypothetical protein [unclassified Sporosarcina]ARK25974.1 hypothetical protein SporoP37_15710 [Sporosarcina sp. P37]PID19342.1 hypothetical protein CSV62_02230 [Sporosarcina sp. P35]
MIAKELLEMNAYMPVKLAELAKSEPDTALELLQAWGDGTKTLRTLWKEVTDALAPYEVKFSS